MALQLGKSGPGLAAEGELSLSPGVVLGVGFHWGRFTPLAPTAHLAFDHLLSARFHLRAGLRAYSFSESSGSWSCERCVFLVPEIGGRFVGHSGFVVEFGIPVARLNVTRLADGQAGAFAIDGDNMFLASILVGFSHQY
ncbi:MAG: hypothetical protein ABIS92_16285 [Polyangia bacterium]